MKIDIKEKLKKIFTKEDLEEVDVVFILSRIRKILEIDNKKGEYKKLKFFCNWALHYKVDDTDSMIEEIEKFISGEISSVEFFNFFHKDLKKFLKKYDISTNVYRNMKNVSKFNYLLAEIFRDAPLIIKYVKKKKLTITSVDWEEIEVGGTKAYSVPMTLKFDEEF